MQPASLIGNLPAGTHAGFEVHDADFAAVLG
jgi:hypothetical protein